MYTNILILRVYKWLLFLTKWLFDIVDNILKILWCYKCKCNTSSFDTEQGECSLENAFPPFSSLALSETHIQLRHILADHELSPF